MKTRKNRVEKELEKLRDTALEARNRAELLLIGRSLEERYEFLLDKLSEIASQPEMPPW
jgi:hypothetical protein